MFFGPRVPNMSNDELRQELEDGSVTLIDVREPREYSAGHVPSAMNLPIGGLPQSAAQLDHGARIVVICQSGNRSVRAGKMLLKAGFSDVRNVAGGTGAWGGKLKR